MPFSCCQDVPSWTWKRDATLPGAFVTTIRYHRVVEDLAVRLVQPALIATNCLSAVCQRRSTLYVGPAPPPTENHSWFTPATDRLQRIASVVGANVFPISSHPNFITLFAPEKR